jgi:uncharacterized protein (TIGR02646 family)
MIKISLPIEHPQASFTLAKEIAKLVAEVKKQVLKPSKTDFSDAFWGKLKNILWRAQGRKCCFCEKKVSLGEGDVEHYRPKRDAKCIDNKNIVLKNGYWWLAYEWKNFLFVCRTCNVQKSNRFPLIDEARRAAINSEDALDDTGKLGSESPSLINPRFEDPENYFSYDLREAHSGKVYINQAGGSPNASISAASILIPDLNRTQRVNSRELKDTVLEERSLIFIALQKSLNELKKTEGLLQDATNNYARDPKDFLHNTIIKVEELLTAQKALVSAYTKFSSPFAGMCRYYLKGEGYQALIEH